MKKFKTTYSRNQSGCGFFYFWRQDKLKWLKKTIAILVILAFWPAPVYSLPQIAEVVSGSAQVQVNGSTMEIQAADNTVINYNSFNIGLGESVNVTLPSSGSQILNRVVGSELSQIFGSLTSNGLFILINPNGVHVGPQATINATNLVLSTRDIDNQAFLNKDYIFEKLSQDQRDVLLLNEGKITLSEGGFGVLIAGGIENTGSIIAPLGTVALAAGDAVRLNVSADGLISVAVEEAAASHIYDKEGNPITDQIKNSGTIQADSGTIILDAKSLPDLFSHVINMEGIITADKTIVGKDGSITFLASGDVYSTGTISSQGGKINLKAGGNIVSLGSLVAQLLNERGAAFLIGGNYIVGQAFVENDDGAANLATGNYSGTTSDVGDLLVNENAIITLIGDTTFTADSDASGGGGFGMRLGSSIVGGGYNFTINTSSSANLRAISGLGSLTINRSGSSATPTLTMNNNITSDSGTTTLGAGVTLSVGGNTLTVNDFSIAGTLNAGSGTIDINDDLDLTGTGTFTQSTNTVTLAGDLTLASGTTFTKATAGQTLSFDGTGTITDNNSTKQDLGAVVIGGTSVTQTLGSAVKMTTLAINEGNTFNLAGYDFSFSSIANVSNQGTFQLQGAETLTNVEGLDNNSGTVLYSGTGSYSSGLIGGDSYYNLTFNGSGGTWDLDANLDVNSTLTMTNGTLDLNGYNLDLTGATFSNSSTLRLQGGETLTAFTNDTDSGTVVYDGTSSYSSLAAGNNYYNLTFNGSGGAWNSGGNMDVNGALTLTNGTLDLNGYNLDLTGGSFVNNSTLRLQGAETLTAFTNDTDSGTVVYDGTGTYTSLAAGANYYHLQFNGSGGSWAAIADTDVDGNLTITSGTFKDGGKTVYLAGNWSNSGTFTPTGTLYLNGGNQTISGSSTFNNITKTPSSQQTLTFENSQTQTVNGTLTLKGVSSDSRLLLRSNSNGTAWKMNPTGTRSVEYLDIKDSNNLNSTEIQCTSGCADSGGNTRWLFALPSSTNNASTNNTSIDQTLRIIPPPSFFSPVFVPQFNLITLPVAFQLSRVAPAIPYSPQKSSLSKPQIPTKETDFKVYQLLEDSNDFSAPHNDENNIEK